MQQQPMMQKLTAFEKNVPDTPAAADVAES